MKPCSLEQGTNVLTLDHLMAALTIDGLASLLSIKRLGNLAGFNGWPVTYSKLDYGDRWRVERINNEQIVWEGMDNMVSSIGLKRVRYSETDKRATLFRDLPVKYVTDQVAGGPPILWELNGNRVLFNSRQELSVINGAIVSYDERKPGLNGHPVSYSMAGNIVSINGRPIVCEPEEKKPSNIDILVLAVLFPPPYSQALRQPDAVSAVGRQKLIA